MTTVSLDAANAFKFLPFKNLSPSFSKLAVFSFCILNWLTIFPFFINCRIFFTFIAVNPPNFSTLSRLSTKNVWISPNLLFASHSSTPSVVIVGEVMLVGVLAATTGGWVTAVLAATLAVPYNSCNLSRDTSVPSLRIIFRKALWPDPSCFANFLNILTFPSLPKVFTCNFLFWSSSQLPYWVPCGTLPVILGLVSSLVAGGFWRFGYFFCKPSKSTTGTVVDLQLKCCGGVGPRLYSNSCPSRRIHIALVLESKVATYSYLGETFLFAA